MADAAKMLGAGNADELVIGVFHGMTVNAIFKTVFFGADALMHSFVALMQDEFHVIHAHEFRVSHAMITLALGNIGQGCARHDNDGRHYCQYSNGDE